MKIALLAVRKTIVPTFNAFHRFGSIKDRLALNVIPIPLINERRGLTLPDSALPFLVFLRHLPALVNQIGDGTDRAPFRVGFQSGNKVDQLVRENPVIVMEDREELAFDMFESRVQASRLPLVGRHLQIDKPLRKIAADGPRQFAGIGDNDELETVAFEPQRRLNRLPQIPWPFVCRNDYRDRLSGHLSKTSKVPQFGIPHRSIGHKPGD